MGAEFVDERLKATNRDEAIAEVKQIIEYCLYDYGHAGYTGTFAESGGVKVVEHEMKDHAVVDLVMKDYDEAYDWLLENCRKWGHVLVVKTRDDGYVAGAWCSS